MFLCLEGKILVCCWVLCFIWPTQTVSQLIKNIFFGTRTGMEQIPLCPPKFGAASFQLILWIDYCLLFIVFGGCILHHFLVWNHWYWREFFIIYHHQSSGLFPCYCPFDCAIQQYLPANQLLMWLDREQNGYCCLGWFLWQYKHHHRQEYKLLVSKILCQRWTSWHAMVGDKEFFATHGYYVNLIMFFCIMLCHNSGHQHQVDMLQTPQ